MPRLRHQNLPASGEARETLREKGQFWTPDWVADAMVAYALQDFPGTLFDPAVGAGAFLRAGKRWAERHSHNLRLRGREIDPTALLQAEEAGLSHTDLQGVELRDFVLDPPEDYLPAIIANPPYMRHHRLPESVKQQLRHFSATILGRPLDGRAGLQAYFLLRMLQRLAPGGRMAVLLPADVCEGVYAPMLWKWIARNFRLDAVMTFAPNASPFPGVDTNALLFFLRNAPPVDSFSWGRVEEAWSADLTNWTISDFQEPPGATLFVQKRTLSEGIETGLSRPQCAVSDSTGPFLGDFVDVMRGIATGANEFFFLTREQAAELQLPKEFLIPAVGRTRDVDSAELTQEVLCHLESKGRPTLLLSPDNRPLSQFPPALQNYLREGERQGLPNRALISQRRPWYKMETRSPAPPFLFAYLGRRNARFIRNEAQVMPLTGFLCLYPKRNDPTFIAGLWRVLQRPETVAALSSVGKSYGNGAIKVEPRALERLPLPAEEVEKAGLVIPRLLLETRSNYE